MSTFVASKTYRI